MKRKEEKIFSAVCGLFCIGLTVIFGFMVRVMYRNHMLNETNGSHHFLRSLSLPILLSVLAIFLLMNRRWAQAVFAVACCAVGGWLAIGSIFEVPFPEMLANIAFGLVLFVPLLLIIRYWKSPRNEALYGT